MSRYNRCKECYNTKCMFVTGEKDDFDSSECADFKPMTKADRIRAMSNEELAEHFTQFYYDGPKFYCPAVADVGEGACAANYDCRQCWLDWLKQEVKDD